MRFQRRFWHRSRLAASGLLLVIAPLAPAQDIIPPVIKYPYGVNNAADFPAGTFIQVGTGRHEERHLTWGGSFGGGSTTIVKYALYRSWGPSVPDFWMYYEQYSNSSVQGSDNYDYYYRASHRLVVSNSGQGVSRFTLRVGPTPGSGPLNDVTLDSRSQEASADAPKISIGIPGPLGSEYGYMTFNQRNGSVGLIASGQISDTPGHALNPFGLELQYDENGVRRTVPVAVGADGRFNVNLSMLMGSGGSTGRPLLLYHRTAGDEVNVGYYGNGTEFTRRSEVKEFQYDSLRNKINEHIKNNGLFRYPRSNGAVIGVRG